MDSWSFEIDNVKTEKANAMRRYRQLRKLATMFRFFEICLVLMFLSYFSSQLPTVFRISGEYFKNLSVFVVSPRFVFLVGNAIILTLLAKSGQQNPNSTSSGTDLYDEFIKNSSETSQNSSKIGTGVSGSVLETEEDEVVFHDKETVYVENSVVPDSSSVMDGDDKRVFRRTRSENLNEASSEKKDIGKELKRSKTSEKCRKVGKKMENNKKREGREEEEEMSNDEFRRKIEEFIAKQKGFLRQESMAIVLQNQS